MINTIISFPNDKSSNVEHNYPILNREFVPANVTFNPSGNVLNTDKSTICSVSIKLRTTM